MRRSAIILYGNAPSVYPWAKPFHDTPNDEDRHRLNFSMHKPTAARWPAWMEEGADGAGTGIGLHRSHPLSKLKGNLRRGKQDVPRVFQMMMTGVTHKSGLKLYYRGGKVPNPSKHPWLTGEPCPVYGWKVLDSNVIRQFTAPVVDKDKIVYKPYVALNEKKMMTDDGSLPEPDSTAPVPVDDAPKKEKPLMKRLFFWK